MINKQNRAPIKLFWWKLQDSNHGNFGDEITRLLIKEIFKRESIWSPATECEMIGAGSILAEVYETKGSNKPYVWSSGLIEDNSLVIPSDSFKFCSVRGKLTQGRIENLTTPVGLGDAGLLASYLLPWYSRFFLSKKYELGILPHYADRDSEFIRKISTVQGIKIIDATRPCKEVIYDISRCEAVLSSSLHGLIVADSVGTPNAHIRIGDKLKGGDYKFNDYYSVFEAKRYRSLNPVDTASQSTQSIASKVKNLYVFPNDINQIKQNIITAFPYK